MTRLEERSSVGSDGAELVFKEQCLKRRVIERTRSSWIRLHILDGSELSLIRTAVCI